MRDQCIKRVVRNSIITVESSDALFSRGLLWRTSYLCADLRWLSRAARAAFNSNNLWISLKELKEAVVRDAIQSAVIANDRPRGGGSAYLELETAAGAAIEVRTGVALSDDGTDVYTP